MPNLKLGSVGQRVKRLQTLLKNFGFDPGDIDGKFGANTERALRAFQKFKRLKIDGIAGPKTMAALSPSAKSATKRADKAKPKPITSRKPKPRVEVPKAPEATGKTTVEELPPLKNVTADLVAQMFPGTPIENIEENLPYVMVALNDAKLGDKQMVLMALATIRAETGNFTPLSEYRSKFNTSPGGHAFNLYDNRKDLGNTGRPDGERYRGRGYVQLTGRTNYQVHGNDIGLDNQLVDQPQLANDPTVAAKLLASFLKSKEAQIRSALRVGDLKTARRLVNGGSHGLDAFSRAFKTGQLIFK